MTIQMILALAILVIMIGLIMFDVLPFGAPPLLACMLLVVTGLSTVPEAFAGFTNPSVIMIASFMVVLAGVQKTRAMDKVKEALIALVITQYFTTIISMMFVTYTINALIAISLFAGLYSKKGGSTAANLSLGLGIASVLIWLLLGPPFEIHVAIIGLPVAGIGYLIGILVGKKPTEAQMAVVDESARHLAE